MKSDTVSTFSPSVCHEVIGPDAMIFVFWMLSFKPAFLLFSFSFIKRRVSSSSLSVIKVVSSAYLRLLLFLPAILIPACASSILGFQMRHSAYKLNKQGSSIMLKRSDKSKHPCVVPCLRAKYPVIHNDVYCVFFLNVLYHIQEVPVYY